MEQLKPLSIGEEPGSPLIIAGPCSAETEEQTLATACGLAAAGVKVFRAGVWKPRTKPGGFEGVGEPGLEWLAKVRRETGMLTSTEVATRAHVLMALAHGIDMLWVGARTSANPFAMQEIADTLAESGRDIPVLVKNPVSPDLELWIGALERLYNAGVRRLGAIHRGFSSYDSGIYRNSPYWHIPLDLRRRVPKLPVIFDPSHLGGKRELIAPLSQRAIDMGFDGLIIESHCNPACAWSDATQQITPEELKKIVEGLEIRRATEDTGSLAELRQQIDELDNKLIETLAKRMEVSRQIGAYKQEHGIPVVQTDRYSDIMTNRVLTAGEYGINPEFMRRILSTIHEESVRQQVELSRR